MNIRKITKNTLLTNNIILFVGTTIASLLNYAFYPVLGRFLSPAQFGEVQVLAALIMQTSLIFGVARIAIIGGVVNALNDKESRALLDFSERVLVELSVFIVIIATIFAPFVAHKLRYATVLPLIVLLPTIITSGIRTSRDSYARAKGHFGYSSIQEIVAALSKVIFATFFVALGLGTVGATLGLLIANIISAVSIVVLTGRLGIHFNLRQLLRFKALQSLTKRGTVTSKGVTTIGIASAGLVIMFLSNIDTIFSKLSLQPEIAGLYSGISVIANIVFFVSGSVTGVLMATIKISNSYRDNLRTLLYSSALLGALSVSVTIIMLIVPELVIKIMLGSKYLPLQNLLPTVALAMLLLAATNLIITYHIALRDKVIMLISLIVLAAVVGSLTINNASPEQIAHGFLLGNQISFIVCAIWTVYWHVKEHRNELAKTH